MKLTEPITIQSTRVIGVICDHCKKEQKNSGLPRDWHEFTSSHSAWGNDSIESVETKTVCSPECYIAELKNETKRLKEYSHYSSDVGEFDTKFAVLLCKYLSDKGL